MSRDQRSAGKVRAIIAALLVLLVAAAAPAQEAEAVGYGYKFEGARFFISLIEIDLNADGSGELRFKRGEEEEIISRPLKLRPETIARIQHLYAETNFLNSREEYQMDKDFSHLGWITIMARQGERQRAARFNATKNAAIDELQKIFRGIATQEIHLLDLELAQQYQPLDLPRQLEMLENDLRLERISEPEQLLPVLRGINANDTLLLIARNKARKIAETIERRRFKTPIRK